MPETGSKHASADLWLPMSNASGYNEFMKTGIKKLQCSRFLLRMAPLKLPGVPKAGPSSLLWMHGHARNQSDCDDSDVDVPKPKKKKSLPKKVRNHSFTLSTTSTGPVPLKISLDALLSDSINALKHKHKVGKCVKHPGIRGYRNVAGLHFELDNNRLQVWAHTIHSHEAGVDISHAPKNFFFNAEKVIQPWCRHGAMENEFNVAMAPYDYQQQWAPYSGYGHGPTMHYPPMMGVPLPSRPFAPPPSPYGYHIPMYGHAAPNPMGMPLPPPTYPPPPSKQ
ncbi:hypothetical protein K466DRAFT_603912 [Polyporus arcularius HHB13444]|uniref:Uncharacterized protein n=1 Tax=Polyporus arcularius HHB13444 TaxID=1314778 RepID=A0A5C3P024_9APHY|nr:hypothetical protein K466DRAFT_603912 [Polyporus arcularius HHB13444]